MVTWRLHKKGVVLVVIGMVFFTIFVFAAGYLTAVMTNRTDKTHRSYATKATTTTRASAATPATTTTTATAEPQHQEPLALQVALFPSEEEAGEFVKSLAEKKLEGAIVPMPTREGPVLYGIEVGEYKTRREALEAAEAMERKYGLVATVVPASKHQIAHSPKS
jgi:cell division septation protein DedD